MYSRGKQRRERKGEIESERWSDYLDDYTRENDVRAFDRIVVATNRHCVTAPLSLQQ